MTEPSGEAEEENARSPEPQAPRRRRRRIAWGAGVTVVVLGLSGTVAYATATSDTDEGLAATPDTAEVVRTTLVSTEQVDGALDYEPVGTVPSASAEGTVTWLPSSGDVVRRGETLYRADNRPRPLLYGKTPFFRELSAGSRGPDVAVLEANLVELGYTGFTEDNHYTWATAQAVRRWQKDLGVQQTGRVAPQDAFVSTGAVRVGEITADLGSPTGGDIMELTRTTRTVSVDLEVRRRHLVDEDAEVEVELPDGRTLEAEVSELGSVVEVPDGGDSLDDATVRLVITVIDEEELGDYEIAPVRVLLETGRAEDVLAVPVESLVALREGGHGVQRVTEAGATEYVAVETGVFADDLVEVSGGSLAEGEKVGVPG
ncbi:peptidoglycan-binding protein [Nocardiopsis exhalans]|uniref:Peptidoglycan-binding protein n=1 Tax=Nocardiopsis exhalans TaxID=163604 RepID=A0ABY5D773_9ACTN|nr:peptidoglycan-binding protein [Nocardiopsis exhalans]USY19073.1 peptidoglycan-binding protein [Nocardiopsis exhalans]